MSYLNLPRLVFAGRFQADVSTYNNTPTNFNNARFDPADPNLTPPAWNPTGTGAWRLVDCVVQSVVYQDGSTATTPEQDPVVGMPVGGARGRTSAKLVDLDSQQQMVSQIWGMRVTLGPAGSPPVLEGGFRVVAFRDIWKRCPDAPGDQTWGAFYQSVLEELAWGPSASRFLRDLQVAGVKRLSIKFNVDGFQDEGSEPGFTYGRIVGSIGPAFDDEPAHFVNGRVLRRSYATGLSGGPLNDAYALVDEARSALVLDWGNSIPTAKPGGGPAKVGTLTLEVVVKGKGVALGTLDASLDAYVRTGGIQTFPLTKDQLEAVREAPLRLTPSVKGGTPLEENPLGVSCRVDQFVFRLSPGEKAPVEIWATRFGRPAPDQPIALAYYDAFLAPGKGEPHTCTPKSAFTFPASVTTDARGRATTYVTAADPGNPRHYIDGQVYGMRLGWGSAQSPDFQPNPTDFVSALVWDAHVYPAAPKWERHVRPIFQQYANLYPVMSRIVDLSDLKSVQAHRGILLLAFGLPVTDPNSMPVTRDLSPAKRAMILEWLRQGAGSEEVL